MVIYYVRPGDTLYTIAQRYGLTMEQILELNPLPDPNSLQVGQNLWLPVPSRESMGPCPPLTEGTRGPSVSRLQQLLTRSGLNPGPIDGIFGSQTQNAVVLLQRRSNLPQTGNVGTAEWQALGVNCRPPLPPFPRPAEPRQPSPARPRQPIQIPPSTQPQPQPMPPLQPLPQTQSQNQQKPVPKPTPPPPPPPAPPQCPELAEGATGEDVQRLQRLLDAAGYPVTVTGVFDQATLNALRTFQSEVGINPTGRADLETWLALGEPCGDLPRPPRHRITRVFEGLRYTFYTDKAVYRQGEPVLMTFIKRNVSDEPITINYPTTQRFDFFVELGQSGIEVWRWSRDRSFNPATAQITLQPAQIQAFQESWDQSSNTGQTLRYPGRYLLTATNVGTERSINIEIELQPAATSDAVTTE
ncbi:peptidoglycan-binding protein [Heliobacterium chlorum]|uniref:Peptidoglycan-binding protein n=1 Tax=Heliobacterium chlorum TaxID=2698 RepID=A0ABR7SZI4_HELCL|nr:peptidoglycan-binding protein [Heliobacterium chlorum]MBC9783948.1 peptidoglycan-binding protein [Heliobacterium chlorum]